MSSDQQNEQRVSRRHFFKGMTLALGSSLLLRPLSVFGFQHIEEIENAAWDRHINISGRYPHLAMFNHGNECGIGAVVPWANRLWAITYSPHDPEGNDHDGLYEITPDLQRIKREESIGGTPAARMIHPESDQLFIGPYAIDKERNVRPISYGRMPGRPTAIARHLTEPDAKIYYFTMEEGVYEVDVNTLEVRTLYLDSNVTPGGNDGGPRLPGYHGKGGYSGQGRVIYANNGRIGTGGVEGDGLIDARLSGGSLATWNGKWGGPLSPEGWQIVSNNQFTEVTGPGGVRGNSSTDHPVWSVGWDHRSLILMLLDDGAWQTFRLPKGDYSYQGLHGWHTEWPRIRQVGPEGQYLMNHHGMWFDFPGDFSNNRRRAPRPVASHLKITGDVARWQDRIIFACDDAALSTFGPEGALVGQSQSNLWVTTWEKLKDNGRPYGWGGPWVHDTVQRGRASDPYAFPGFTDRQLHLSHLNNYAITFVVEVDRTGTGDWEQVTDIMVPAHGYVHYEFSDDLEAEWVRLTPDRDGKFVSAYFHYGRGGGRRADADLFRAVAPADSETPRSVGLVYPRGGDRGTLQFAAWSVDGTGSATEAGYYEIGEDMKLQRVDDPEAHRVLKEKAAIGASEFDIDDASVIVEDHWGQRYRLPKGDPSFDRPTDFGTPRVRREVATERDLFNVHGTVYCLPRPNSGGLANIKPVATHNKRFTDFCSWRGLLVLAGCRSELNEAGDHGIVSDDGNVALWVGDYDDLWKLGKPRGIGGPWKNTEVEADLPSDPYIMTGFDEKHLELSHDAADPVTFIIEVKFVMNLVAVHDEFGMWHAYETVTVAPGETKGFEFPDGFSAHWVRLKADRPCAASAIFTYS